jgi:hypothetical protein
LTPRHLVQFPVSFFRSREDCATGPLWGMLTAFFSTGWVTAAPARDTSGYPFEPTAAQRPFLLRSYTLATGARVFLDRQPGAYDNLPMKTRQLPGHHGTSPNPPIEDRPRDALEKPALQRSQKVRQPKFALPRGRCRSDGNGEIRTIKPAAVLPGPTHRLFALVRGVPESVLRTASNRRNRSSEAERSKQRVE